jgi:transcriptional antiterminator RfaH
MGERRRRWTVTLGNEVRAARASARRARFGIMPILKKEDDLFPQDLFRVASEEGQGGRWWALYTPSKREKQLMRCLRRLEIPHYGPLIKKRYRSPNGRIRESFAPLFANYVFIYGDEMQRYQAVSTGYVSRYLEAPNCDELTHDLSQIQRVIALDLPLTPESQLQAGDAVRVKSGLFAGFEGVVIRRERKTCLLVWVRLLNQGVSAQLDEAVLEPRT